MSHVITKSQELRLGLEIRVSLTPVYKQLWTEFIPTLLLGNDAEMGEFQRLHGLLKT